MEKMTLERFREIRKKTEELFNLSNQIDNQEIQLTNEEEENIEREFEALINEIKNSDLSDIPFEEYEGFYDFGFDFEGTGANIDFKIINYLGRDFIKLKGCNVRNFDFENIRYNDESFDEEVMVQHPDKFKHRDLPKEVRDRYYRSWLTIEDIVRYNLYEDIDRIDGNTPGGPPSFETRFFKKVKPNIARIIEPDLFEILGFEYYLIEKIEEYEGEITEEVLKKTVDNVIQQLLNSGRADLYIRMTSNPRIRALIPEEQVIDFGENEELTSKYCWKSLLISDVYENQAIFRKKRFVNRLTDYSLHREKYDAITEEKIFYVFDNYPDIALALADNEELLLKIAENIDVKDSNEENLARVQRTVEDIIDKGLSTAEAKTVLTKYYSVNGILRQLYEYEKSKLENILRYTTEQRIREYGIPIMLLKNHGLLGTFDAYGLETVMEFDRRNGNIFSKNNFEIAQYLYYVHRPTVELGVPYSLEDFEEQIYQIIANGTGIIDYRNFSENFRSRYPKIFLDEDAPQELQDKFYTKTIDIEDFKIHPEWINFLEGKDFEVAIKNCSNVSFLILDDFSNISFWEALRKIENSESAVLKFVLNNITTINMIEEYSKNNVRFSIEAGQIENWHSLEDFKNFLEKNVEDKIISGNIEYDEHNIPDFFREKHTDYFLEDDSPEALKNLFYPGRRKKNITIDIEELKKTTNWQEFLLGKNEKIVREVLKKFVELNNTEAIRDTVLFFLSKQPEMAIYMIECMKEEQILANNISLPENQIRQLMEQNPDNALKILLLSEKTDKEKLLKLIGLKELNNYNNSIQFVLSNICRSNDKLNYDEINHEIDEIYNLFTYENLPEFLKTFKLFELGRYSEVNNSSIISYQNLDSDSRKRIMMTDLFRISLDSNNRSLRDFAEIMRYGDKISRRIYQSSNIDLSVLSNEEQVIFKQYVDTLVAVHNISTGLNKNKQFIYNTHDVITDYSSLLSQYSQNNRALESSIILTELFQGEIQGEIQGELTPESILLYMDKKHESSSKRRTQNAKKISQGNLYLESGDYIKGIQDFESYLTNMLECGLKGGEFNREHSHSDATPLDLDFGYISNENLKNELKTDAEIISDTISAGYGNSWIVLKQYGLHFEDKQENMPIQFTRLPEYWTHYPDDNLISTKKDRYVRTGIGSEDIDYIVSDEWKTYLGYKMAMAGIFIPVKDANEQLVFSEEDYNRIREQMRGLSYYNAEPFKVSPKTKQVTDLFKLYRRMGGTEEKIDSVQEVLSGKEDNITQSKKKSTLGLLNDFFQEKGIHATNNLSLDLSPETVELIDIGSTGRGTNVPGDGDFDFMLRNNLPREALLELQSHIFGLKYESTVVLADGFRVKGAVLPDGQTADIDITYAKKDLGLEYSSDMCIKDRLNSIYQSNPEAYNYVLANIIMAKNILKQMGIYKKRGSDGATEYGGFGGIGVENWILQNGGSFATAIDTFLEATENKDGKELPYYEFVEKYPIYDFGNNHREGKLQHDRFSSFLGSEGEYDNHEKAFSIVKNKFREIQSQLHEISLSQEASNENRTNEDAITSINTDTEPISPLRQSISVEGLREASREQDGYLVFCEQNFILMSRLAAKYARKTRDYTPENTNGRTI